MIAVFAVAYGTHRDNDLNMWRSLYQELNCGGEITEAFVDAELFFAKEVLWAFSAVVNYLSV